MTYNVAYILGVFLANGIGCVLAVFCLVRMTDERRSRGNRAFLVLAAAWGLVETARDDTLFVMVTAVHLRDDQMHFYLAPGLGLTVLAVLIAIAVLGAAAVRPSTARTVVAGVTVGLLTAAMVVQSALSGRSGYALSIDAAGAAVVAAGLAVVTAVSVWLATGATSRWAMSIPIMALAACMTGAMYLIAAQVTVDPATVNDDDSGVTTIQLILITAVAFGIRAIALTMISLTDEGRVERAEEHARAHGWVES